MSNIERIDAVESIQKHPHIYLNGASDPNPSLLLQMLVFDILFYKAYPILIDRSNSWWFVAAGKNWTKEFAQGNLPHIFNNLLPFPEIGRNSHHAEVVVAAFCCSLVVFEGDRSYLIRGEEAAISNAYKLLPEAMKSSYPIIVAFSM